MQNFRCKHCRDKKPIDSEIILSWISRFCSLWCRRSFTAEVNKKAKEKIKVKNAKTRAKKKDSITNIKKRLWETVSLYIRLRDSDDDNFCKCITCPESTEKRHYKDSIQAWHYVPSWSSSFHRYNEKNIHSQCYWCNVWKGWNLIEYRPFMIKKYWQDYVDYLFDTRNELIDLWKVELKEIHEEYKIKLAELKLNKAID